MVKLRIWKPSAYDDADVEGNEEGSSYTEEDEPEDIDGTVDDKKIRCWSKIGDSLSTLVLVIYDNLPWRHILPILVLILYTVFGGWLFRHLEVSGANGGENEEPILAVSNVLKPENTSEAQRAPEISEETLNRLSMRTQMASKLRSIERDSSLSTEERRKLEDEAWNWYDGRINSKCGEEESVDSKWEMWNSMFFAATLYTTIGYGHIAPTTVGGRVATMVYAIIGIPLVLTILSNWGNLLFEGLKRLMRFYNKIKHRGSIWVPMADLPDGIDELPVALAVFLLIFWIGTCAGIFVIWEDWDYFTSLYFFFISLTTIGLGDVVPAHPKYTLMSFVLVLCGLSVVSMSFNIIQTKIENVFKSMMFGIEQEYWQKQVEPGTSRFGEDGMNASVGVMQLWRKKPLRERILFRLMDKSKKEMLHAYWEKKANTRNEETQTIPKTYASSVIQVDMEEEELKTKYKNRKYVYNLAD